MLLLRVRCILQQLLTKGISKRKSQQNPDFLETALAPQNVVPKESFFQTWFFSRAVRK